MRREISMLSKRILVRVIFDDTFDVPIDLLFVQEGCVCVFKRFCKDKFILPLTVVHDGVTRTIMLQLCRPR